MPKQNYDPFKFLGTGGNIRVTVAGKTAQHDPSKYRKLNKHKRSTLCAQILQAAKVA